MAKSTTIRGAGKKLQQVAYISVPSQIIRSSLSSAYLHSLLLPSPTKKSTATRSTRYSSSILFLLFLFLFLLFFFAFLSLSVFKLAPLHTPCLTPQSDAAATTFIEEQQQGGVDGVSAVDGGEGVSDFWKQPDGLGYKPCLTFTEEYKKESAVMLKDRTKYLLVVVSGGLNQQRNQIVDAVVIARILGAALVVPILQVNVIWGDER